MEQLAHPPVVEAVLDLDCKSSEGLDLLALKEPAQAALGVDYPAAVEVRAPQISFQTSSNAPATMGFQAPLAALRFAQTDGKQLVQFRPGGYSFNRLAPYASLDSYLAEIERTWRIYQDLAKPTELVAVRLRYINRILLPIAEGRVELDRYLAFSDRDQHQGSLNVTDFLNRYRAVETVTGNRVQVTLASQPSELSHLPILLDIEAAHEHLHDHGWQSVLSTLTKLRDLKNAVFERTLTQECLALFR